MFLRWPSLKPRSVLHCIYFPRSIICLVWHCGKSLGVHMFPRLTVEGAQQQATSKKPKRNQFQVGHTWSERKPWAQLTALEYAKVSFCWPKEAWELQSHALGICCPPREVTLDTIKAASSPEQPRWLRRAKEALKHSLLGFWLPDLSGESGLLTKMLDRKKLPRKGLFCFVLNLKASSWLGTLPPAT